MARRETSRVCACIGLLLLVLVAASGGSAGAEEETQILENEAGTYRMRIPSTWTLGPYDEPGSVIARLCQVPGVSGFVTLAYFDLEGVELTPRSQAFLEQPYKRKDYDATSVEVRTAPFPHLVVLGKRGDVDWVALFGYRRHKGHGLHLRIEAHREAFDQVYEPFIAMALTLEADVESWPSPPEGYKLSKHKDLHFYAHPNVRSRALKEVARFVGQVERRFEDFHGKIRRSDDEPTTIIVHRYAGEAKHLSEAAAGAVCGAWAEPCQRRAYAIQLSEKRSTAHATLARALIGLLLAERYAAYLPAWVGAGEGWRAWSWARTEGKGPVVTNVWKQNYKGIRLRLDEIEGIVETDWETYVEHARVYVFLFRHGPSKYRKAYRRFLQDVDQDGDVVAALEEHLYSLDLAEMVREARSCIRKKAKVVSVK